MTRIAILPLDDRPANYDYPRHLARAAGFAVTLPPREWLGNPWRDSQHADLVDWWAQTASEADAVIVAIDTLAYGGLIPSRTSTEPTAAVLNHLAILRELKSARPRCPILAFNVVMRTSRADSSEEEKPYWGTYGSRMFRLSYLDHKTALGEASAAETAERDALRAQIPVEVYEDYHQGRTRNHAVNRAMLDWLADVAFVNGADLVLGNLLLQHPEVAHLAAYGGWNTAGNTLGTVLAQAVIRVLALRSGVTREQAGAHLEFLFLRFLDDYFYQARERTRCLVEDLPALGLLPTEQHWPDPDQAAAVEARVRARLTRAAADLRDLFIRSGLVREVHVTRIHLPWQRLFEVGFDVHAELTEFFE